MQKSKASIAIATEIQLSDAVAATWPRSSRRTCILQKPAPTASSSPASRKKRPHRQPGGGSGALSAARTSQASTVKQMKKDGKPADEIQKAVEELQRLRAELAIAEKANAGQGTEHNIDRKLFDETVLRRMFVVPAFEIHGGVAGLFDYGPPGAL